MRLTTCPVRIAAMEYEFRKQCEQVHAQTLAMASRRKAYYILCEEQGRTRAEALWDMQSAGASMAELCAISGLSASRVRVLIKKEARVGGATEAERERKFLQSLLPFSTF